jgi:Trypsin-like peptidase domain
VLCTAEWIQLAVERISLMPPSRRLRKQPFEITLSIKQAEDLLRCAVLLERPFTETVEVDGETLEVWLKPLGGKPPAPKMGRQLGTGFLVANDGAAFLVTAGHVARRMDHEASLSCADRKGRRSIVKFQKLLPLRRRKVPWQFHHQADVAALRLPMLPPDLGGRFLDIKLLARQTTVPTSTLDLVAVGFPLGLINETHFTPITKRFHTASGILRFRGEEMKHPGDFFLLDQPTMGGYSGAPVFVAPQARVEVTGQVSVVEARCVGLISQTISDEAGGQFAAVVPSAAVRSLVAPLR